MTEVTRYATLLGQELPAILAMSERAVNIDSGTYVTEGVSAVISLWTDMLQEMGFSVERRPLPGFGDQMTARMPLGGNGPRLLVLGHADTVWPAGVARESPFRREGDRLTGPGVGDMKTNVVVAQHALRVLLAEGALAGLASVTVLIMPDEEIGSPGSRNWIEEEARQADLCLTLEPCRPNGGMVIGRGAVGALYLEARGVTAHCGSAREKGASTVAALASLVPALEALATRSEGSPRRSGSSVAARRGRSCRAAPKSTWTCAHPTMQPPKRCWRRCVRWWRAPVMIRACRWRCAAVSRDRPSTHPGTRALYALAEEFGRALNVHVHSVVSRGGSDGSFATRLGVPTLDGLGPTTHETCSRREWVEVGSIVPRGAILAGLIPAAAAGKVPG